MTAHSPNGTAPTPDSATAPAAGKSLARRGCTVLALACVVVGVCTIIVAAIHSVPRAVTEDDVRALTKILGSDLLQARPGTFEEELAFIESVQRAVANTAPQRSPIPYNHRREPADLVREQTGICYDRSRTLEKALRLAGLEVRHAALYSLDPMTSWFSILAALTTRRRLPSHAVSECLTLEGWLVVDSNQSWVSLDNDQRPVSLAEMRAAATDGAIDWREPPAELIYRRPFVYVYGLYSRHGRFYPPFNPIPDVNWRELLWNFR